MFNSGEDFCKHMPKVRDLRPSKKYREAVARWGAPNKPRKRVVIVNSIKCEARDVEIRDKQEIGDAVSNTELKSNSGLTSIFKRSSQDLGGHCLTSDADKLGERGGIQAEGYRKWLAERKKLRHDLNACGLNKVWLSSKTGRTDLENRVLRRLKDKKTKTETRVKKVLLPKMEADCDDSLSGQDRGVPTIRHPAPAALAIIEEYLARKRLRLVDLFQQADKDKNWTVTREEFLKIMKSVKMPLTEADLEDLIISLDKDDDDALDYRELAIGRQAYLEERISSPSKMNRKDDQAAPVTTKRPEPIPEEHEWSQEDASSRADASFEDNKQRPRSPAAPSVPGRSSSPSRTTAGQTTPPPRPPSAGRPLSPGSTLPVIHHGRSDSAGSGGRMAQERPTAYHNAISRSSSSPTLMVPPAQLTDKVKRPTDEEIKEVRMMKQQKRKQKVKAQKRRGANEKPTRKVAPSSIGGTTADLVDKYRQLTLKEYEDVVELCHMQGVQLSRPLLERVLLHPDDKPTSVCLTFLRQPGNTAGRVKRKYRSRTPGTPRLPSSSAPSPVPLAKRKPRLKPASSRPGSTS